jgi:hypothetical protein
MRERALQHATLDTLAIQLQYVGLTRNGPSADRVPPTRRAVRQAHRLGPSAPTAEPQLLGALALVHALQGTLAALQRHVATTTSGPIR